MIGALKKFFDFCLPDDRRKFYLSIALGVISAFCSALRIPALFVVVRGIVGKNLSPLHAAISFAIMLLSVIAASLINKKTTMLQTEAGYNTCASKRMQIAEHLRYLPMGGFTKNSLGQIAAVTTNTMENLSNVATRVVMMVTRGVITSSLIALMMLAFNWKVGLITFAGIFLFFAVNSLMQTSMRKISVRKIKADENLVAKVLEFVQGIAEVKNFNLTKSASNKLNDAIDEANHVCFAMEIPAVTFTFFQNLMTKGTGIAICLFSISLYLQGQMDLSNCVLMQACAFMIYESLDNAGSYSALLRAVETSVAKANDILSLPTMKTTGSEITPKSFDLEMKDVEFSYGKKKIINGVSLSIPQNKATAIVGPSGGGKSTITQLLARFWDVDKGEVFLGKNNVRDFSYDSLMKNFAFVFQNVYLFSDTIANNIRFGVPNASMEDVVAAAKKACCHDFIMALPKGYDTVIGEGGATLSGGEKQRVSIARAIMKDAPIIILDEATANVDPESEEDLIKAIEALTKKKTIVMIAHRLKTVKNAAQILVVDKGKIVQQGSHQELVKQQGIYKNFVSERKQAVGWKL
ncbi:MAG: ABC transporter ATP-binding protein/permease, partial [Treponema sp.]|nr:ABC transporter ATP-binding protein/permease [Treponema sp.]